MGAHAATKVRRTATPVKHLGKFAKALLWVTVTFFVAIFVLGFIGYSANKERAYSELVLSTCSAAEAGVPLADLALIRYEHDLSSSPADALADVTDILSEHCPSAL